MRKEGGLTDAQLVSATGKNWEQWRAIVSTIPMNPAATLRSVHGLDTWWSEVITAAVIQSTGQAAFHRNIEGSLRKLFTVCRDAEWRPVVQRALESNSPDTLHKKKGQPGEPINHIGNRSD